MSGWFGGFGVGIWFFFMLCHLREYGLLREKARGEGENEGA